MKKILFYEFSDLNRKPVEFINFCEFIKFCNDYNILYNLDDVDVEIIGTEDVLYATCLKGTNVCIYGLNEKPTLKKETEEVFREFLKNVKKHAIVFGHPASWPCQMIDIETFDKENKTVFYTYFCGGGLMAKRNTLYYRIKNEYNIDTKNFFNGLKKKINNKPYTDNKWEIYQKYIDDFREKIII